MIGRSLLKSVVQRRLVARFSNYKTNDLQEAIIFPRETEGNIITHNWSLVIDGVTPTGGAYVNPRIELLAQKLGVSKSTSYKLKSPNAFGTYKIVEAGDSIDHNNFQEAKELQTDYLEKDGTDLYAEDGGLGSYSGIRVGARIISNNPAWALIARNLFIRKPPRDINHLARFNGWNLGPHAEKEVIRWDGKHLHIEAPTVAEKGERPIVAFIGHLNDFVGIQFVESDNKIVGANIVVGEKAPVRAVIEAMGTAADAMINEDDHAYGFSIPSTTIVNNGRAIVIVDTSDDVINTAASKNILYGAYNNFISNAGISAIWNGYITTQSIDKSIQCNDGSVVALNPDNMIHAPTDFIFIDTNATNKTLSEDEAATKLIDLVGENKADVIKDIVKNKKFHVVTSTADAFQLI